MSEPTIQASKLGLNNNLWKFYLGAFLGGFAFFYNAVDTLYYRHFGLSYQQIGWIISASLIANLIMEVPSGAFADLHGKKKTLVISAIFNFIATGLVALGSSFPIFVLGFVFWGIGRAFSSGASNALLFDTLKALGREKEYLKHTGRLSSFFISIDVISSALAPLLFAINVRLPYFVSLSAAFLVIIIQLNLREALITTKKLGSTINENVKQIASGVMVALNSKIFLWLTFFNVLIFTANKAIAEMISTPFLTSYIGFSLPNLSVILVIGSLIQSSSVFFADKIEHKLGDNRSFIWIILALPMTIFFYAFSRKLMLTSALTGLYFSTVSFSEVVVENYLTHNIPDDKRATILSISSMFVSVFALISLPIIGGIVDLIPLQNSLILVAATVAILGLILLSQYKSSNAAPIKSE